MVKLLQVEQSIWNDFLMKQAPVIVVLGIVLYFMYKYFVAQQEKKDTAIKEKDALIIATIEAKDEQIKEQAKAVMDLYGKAIDVQSKGNIIQEQLIELIKETREDISELNKKIQP